MDPDLTIHPALPRRVVPWRERQLVAAGFDAGLAAALARDPRSNLHALIELTERGCPPALAARILAPHDEPGGGR